MTKRDFATKLYVDLKQNKDIQKAVDSIKSATVNDEPLSVDEQLEIVDLIRQIHTEKTTGLFESVEAFLTLVSHVEVQIKAQSASTSANGGGNNNNAGK